VKNITPNLISEQIFNEIKLQEEEERKMKEEKEKEKEIIDPNSTMKKKIKN